MRLPLIPSTIAVLVLAMTPATAQQRQGSGLGPYIYTQPYPPRGGVRSDPSFGNRIGINNERASGRCVVDLGYGRWEPC
jgi:hypothetical protein